MTTRIQHVVKALQFMYPKDGWRIEGDIGININNDIITEDNAFNFFYTNCTSCSSDLIDVMGKKIVESIPLIDEFPLRPIPFQFSEILKGIHGRLSQQFGDDKTTDIIRGLSHSGIVNEIYETFILVKVLMQRKKYTLERDTFCLRVLCVNNMLQIVPNYRYGFNIVTNIDGGNVAVVSNDAIAAMEDMYRSGFVKIGDINVPAIS